MKEFALTGSGGEMKRVNYSDELNEQQLKVVTEADGAALVLAGAGSGKTRTITYRVSWLLEHGVHPSEILLVTFTNKAAREMQERVEGLLGTYPNGLTAGTFHSIAARFLRTYAEELGYSKSFSILSQEDARDLISLCVKDLKIDTKGKRFPSSGVLLGLFSYVRNIEADLEEYIEEERPKLLKVIDDILAVYRKYLAEKQQQNVMDFDDLLLNFQELLAKDHLRTELSSRFRYILVDEFQDTNSVQATIVNRLAEVHKNILVVGDDAQSIYSFRGAEIRNILDFPKRYKDAKTFYLTMNYRSTPEILDVANASIENNADQFEKELQAYARSGDLPLFVPAKSKFEEAQYIAEQILELHQNGTDFHEMAVLFRAAFHSQSLEFELMKRDIPYDYRGGMKFFERSHIKDIVSHLRILNNVKDGMAWVRILRLHPGIGLVTAGRVAETMSHFDRLEDALREVQPPGKRAAAGFDAARDTLLAMIEKRHSISDMVRSIAANDDYIAYLENEFPNYKDRIEDIEQFAIFAEQFTELSDFLESISLTDEYGVNARERASQDEDRIVLSTVHQAKGLEWNVVFVMHLAEGTFPHARAYQEDSELEEERRLFYVAATRARRQLFLTYPETAGYDTLEFLRPSQFIEEIPTEYLEEVKLRRSSTPSFHAPNRRPRKQSFDGYEEPAIVLDDSGEVVSRPTPPSFLSDY
jgi:DNA helicase-2/ATP-dependent DNA helicase PcrA